MVDLYFFIVLDNVKSLLELERKNKVIEKLAIIQSLAPAAHCFSIIAINDSLIDETKVFKEHTNIFTEYLFTVYFFRPASEPMLKQILWQSLSCVYPDCEFLPTAFENFYLIIYGTFKDMTSNIHEFQYLFRFLYPRFV